MGSIFKKFGQGILYILVLPIFLLAVTIFGIYGVGLFVVLMIKSIISFFKGKSLYEDLPEDIEAQKILHPEKVKPTPTIEDRPEVVVIDRSEEERRRELEDRPRPSAISTSETPIREEPHLIEEDRRYESLPIDEDDEIDEEDDDLVIYDESEEEEDEDIETITISEEEEEEDIPTLKEESKISEGIDDDDDSPSGVTFTDWRNK